ncbi:MAG: glycosyltransferase [bacterium]
MMIRQDGVAARDRAALVFAVPTVGHVNHCVALAHLLRNAGFAPLLVTGHTMAGYLESLELDLAWRVDPAFDLRFGSRRRDGRSHFEQVFDPAHVAAAFDHAVTLINHTNAALVVSKDYVAPHLAGAARRVPTASYLTDGLGPLLDHRIRQRRLGQGMADGFLSVAAQWGVEEAAQVCVASPAPGTLRLVRGFPEMEDALTAATAADALFLGALVFDGSPAEIDRWRRRVRRGGRPLVYVNLGTVAYHPGPYRRLLEAITPLDVDILVACLNLDFAAIGPLPDNVRLERYVPNVAALEAADLMVHHGGHGGLLSALCTGTPSLVAPLNTLTSAQGHHGDIVERLGVGFKIADDDSGDAIRAAAQLALGPACRTRAANLAERLGRRTTELQASATERLAAVRRSARNPERLSRGP